MRIVFFTREGFDTDPYFLYMYSQVAARFEDVAIVAVTPGAANNERSVRVRRWLRKFGRLGFWKALEILSSYPLQSLISRRDEADIGQGLRALPRPERKPDLQRVVSVTTVNGPDAQKALASLEPDVIIQSGAGILKSNIFSLANLGTLNVHHGIAPLIKGMSSIQWALLERKPEWMGATVHWIDEGIDTGDVLAYAPVRQTVPGEGFAPLFVRASEGGIAQLLGVLERLERGERWRVEPPQGESVYRSTISGWKLGILELRRVLGRR